MFAFQHQAGDGQGHTQCHRGTWQINAEVSISEKSSFPQKKEKLPLVMHPVLPPLICFMPTSLCEMYSCLRLTNGETRFREESDLLKVTQPTCAVQDQEPWLFPLCYMF